LNYFLPVIKLVDKTGAGSKVRSETAFPRSTTSPQAPTGGSWLPRISVIEVKAELTRRRQSYNPVLLQQEVHRAVAALMELNQQKALIRRQPLADAALENI
jgi:hypothetical protein